MRRPHLPVITAAAAVFIGITTAAIAQTLPINPIAPGSGALPPIGGVSPGNVPIAPGASAPGGEIELVGPGGVRLAPGGAGLGGGSLVSRPAVSGGPVR